MNSITLKKPIETLTDAVSNTLSVSEFIEALDRLVPNCHPRVADSDRQIWMAVGRRELVQELGLIVKQLEQED